MKTIVSKFLIAAAIFSACAFGQIKQTKEQILFYTSEWKGDRFPDGRPKVPDSLLVRALDVSIEDIWDFLRGPRLRESIRNRLAGFTYREAIRRPRSNCAIHARGGPIWRMPWRPRARRKAA
ncbi:MAG: hypothetical protein WDO73_23540 [Ignavibacteriota bacterium]